MVPPLVVSVIVGAVSIGAVQLFARRQVDTFVMGVIRDLGRYKAKKRRMANAKGLMIQTLFQQDDPLEDLLLDSETNNDDLPTFTLDELEEFGDGQEGRPILIAIFGRVYDVSKGAKFYGPSGTYGHFAGRDVTYSLSTGCKTIDCVGRVVSDDEGSSLTDRELQEGKRWLSFFHLHDKYPLVGTLQEDTLQILLDELLQQKDGEEQAEAKNPILNPE